MNGRMIAATAELGAEQSILNHIILSREMCALMADNLWIDGIN